MRRFILKGLFLGGLAGLLPACGSTDSEDPPAIVFAASPTPLHPGIETFPSEGGMHVPAGSIVVYGTDPPTSGNHYPEPAEGGYYSASIAAPYLVHSLEHGAVVIYYHPNILSAPQKSRLRTIAENHPGVFAQVICVPRYDSLYPVILTAWTHRQRLGVYNRDDIEGFVTLFLDEGPEHAPPAP